MPRRLPRRGSLKIKAEVAPYIAVDDDLAIHAVQPFSDLSNGNASQLAAFLGLAWWQFAL